MIQKAVIKDIPETEEKTFLAPYAGDVVFIIDETHLILGDAVHEDYVDKDNLMVFDIIETYE